MNFKYMGRDLRELTIQHMLLAMQDHKDSPEIRDIIFAEARRRDMCFFNLPEDFKNTQATAKANLSQQMGSPSHMMNAAAPKFSKGDVVYLRAVMTEVGDCGQIGVAVKQPGDKVVVQFIPAEQEIFRAKRQPKAEIILE